MLIELGLSKSTTPIFSKLPSYVALAFSVYCCIKFVSSSSLSDAIYILCSSVKLEKSKLAFGSSGNSVPVNTFISGFSFCSFTISALFTSFITYSLSSFVYPTVADIAVATVPSFGLIIPAMLISSASSNFSFI